MTVASFSVPSISVPRGVPVAFCLPWEALQDQQVDLTQAPFKLLTLHWDLEHVRFSACPLREESLFPIILWFS